MSGCGGGGSQFDQWIVWDIANTHRQLYCLVYNMYLHVICPSLVHMHRRNSRRKRKPIHTRSIQHWVSSFPICPVDCIVFASLRFLSIVNDLIGWRSHDQLAALSSAHPLLLFYVHFILHVDMSCYLEGHVMIGMASQYTIHFCPLYLMEEKL